MPSDFPFGTNITQLGVDFPDTSLMERINGVGRPAITPLHARSFRSLDCRGRVCSPLSTRSRPVLIATPQAAFRASCTILLVSGLFDSP